MYRGFNFPEAVSGRLLIVIPLSLRIRFVPPYVIESRYKNIAKSGGAELIKQSVALVREQVTRNRFNSIPNDKERPTDEFVSKLFHGMT
jgi:hypothetical protein